jgi:disease resistance protein RPM1
VKNMRNVVSTGYYNLPLHLKACLLYISIFPENFEIRSDRLVWRWVRFVHPSNEQGDILFHVGQSSFYDIVNKSMIQFLDFDYSHDGYRDECCCSEGFHGFHHMLVKS